VSWVCSNSRCYEWYDGTLRDTEHVHCKQVCCLPFLCRLSWPKRARNMTMLWFPVQQDSWWSSISFRLNWKQFLCHNICVVHLPDAFDRRHCGLARHYKTDPTDTVALCFGYPKTPCLQAEARQAVFRADEQANHIFLKTRLFWENVALGNLFFGPGGLDEMRKVGLCCPHRRVIS
jgi:hypothetical protein